MPRVADAGPARRRSRRRRPATGSTSFLPPRQEAIHAWHSCRIDAARLEQCQTIAGGMANRPRGKAHLRRPNREAWPAAQICLSGKPAIDPRNAISYSISCSRPSRARRPRRLISDAQFSCSRLARKLRRQLAAVISASATRFIENRRRHRASRQRNHFDAIGRRRMA